MSQLLFRLLVAVAVVVFVVATATTTTLLLPLLLLFEDVVPKAWGNKHTILHTVDRHQ
jgi:hypothetical protein